jgi:DNA repair photolyase
MPQFEIFARDATTEPSATVGVQGDIAYIETGVGSALNDPRATGMGYWSINPYVGCAFGCVYCYARYAHRYRSERIAARADEAGTGGVRAGAAQAEAEHVGSEHVGSEHVGRLKAASTGAMPPAWLAFERRIFVKRNVAEVVRGALASGGRRYGALIAGEWLVIGTATDPYQPAERRFRLTRDVLRVLAEHEGVRLVVITKSPLVTRDIDLLSRLAARGRVTVHVSLITLDGDLARRLEPRAPTPAARIRAIERLARAGIDVGVNIMPVLPGITDDRSALDAVIARIAESGASHVNAGSLRLRSDARRRFLPFVEAEFPALAARYRATYVGTHELGERYRAGLRRMVARSCATHGIRFGRSGGVPDDGIAEGIADVAAAGSAAQLALSV